jgi:hypothetical protein
MGSEPPPSGIDAFSYGASFVVLKKIAKIAAGDRSMRLTCHWCNRAEALTVRSGLASSVCEPPETL